MRRLDFKVQATASGSRARAGRFRTLHNEVLTPVFMPVGTHAAVRAQRREDLIDSGAQVLLANTYHLLLRPGVEIFEKFGGIHRFMNWPRSVLTDSGGFQIFSLPGSRTLREECAEFKSYVDRRMIRLSPERSIAAQRAIGADIMMVLDQCVPSTVEHGVAREAMQLTHRWAARSLAARGDSPQALFGIVQGASYPDLRVASARAVTDLPFEGFAIGGLAVGESAAQREDCTALVTEHLPADRPRYLMGVGTTRDLLEAVHRGVDMFDCILPTALAKQGVAFTSLGRRDLRRAAYRGMDGPIDPDCGCYTCRTFSIAYLYHLNRVRETTGWQLLGVHNLHFYMQLMRRMREHILAGTWLAFYHAQRDVLDARDRYGTVSKHIPKAQRRLRRLQLGRYEVVVRDELGHIRDRQSGEVMHPVHDPAEEARSLYVDQSRLLGRLDAADPRPLVVWDVGLGAAANAMAAIHAVEARRRGAGCIARPGRALLAAGEFRARLGRAASRASTPQVVQTPAACGTAAALGAGPLEQPKRGHRLAAAARRLRPLQVRRAAAGHRLLRSFFAQDRPRTVDAGGVPGPQGAVRRQGGRIVHLHGFNQRARRHAGGRILRREGNRDGPESRNHHRAVAASRGIAAHARAVGGGLARQMAAQRLSSAVRGGRRRVELARGGERSSAVP